MKFGQYRYLFFLRDVLWLAIYAVGGPNAHLGYFINLLVKKRKYLTETEFLELNALCQLLPGPTSTQVIVAVGYKIGKARLAYLTLMVWSMPAVICMITAAYFINQLPHLNFTEYILPLAIAMVFTSSSTLVKKSIVSKTAAALFFASCASALYFKSSYVYPFLIFIGGFISSFKWEKNNKISEQNYSFDIPWANFVLYVSVYLITLILGGLTDLLPIKLFQNFYRIGSLIFGGGNVLISILYTEFVEMKAYLTRNEFISGYAISQIVPGPVFSIVSYIGALALRDLGLAGFIMGGIVAAAGIFLPGTFLIFFVIRIWENLKKLPIIKAALEGFIAVSAGLLAATAIMLVVVMPPTLQNFSTLIFSMILLYFKINPAILIILAVLAGIIF